MQKINLNIIVRSGNYMNVCFCSIRVSKEFLNIYIYIYEDFKDPRDKNSHKHINTRLNKAKLQITCIFLEVFKLPSREASKGLRITFTGKTACLIRLGLWSLLLL